MLTQTGAGAKTFTWDGKGRLATVAMGGTTERYAYDPMNHRIKRSGGSVGNLDYFLEGDHLESVYSGGTLQEKYFRGSTIDELVAGYTYQSGSLTPVMFQHDQVMSVSATTKPNGGTQATATFWAFGETQATTGTLASRLMFTGRENDGTWLYQYRARYYDPSTGRFISEDPKGFAAGINFYAYAGNNPLDANDPSGMVYIFVGGAGDSSLSGIVRNYAADFRPLTGQQVIYRTWDQGSDIQKYIAGLPTGEPINLIGHSYGGDTAATIAANSSRRINMLVTIDPVSQIKPNFSAINQNTNMWVSVNATGGSAFEQSNLIAGLGGAWDSSPQGAATSYISAPKAVHADFGKMMSTTGPGARSPLDLINDSDIAGISGRLQSSAADGGFLLYPNKPNTNQMRSVYAK
jgi:RHS repeat-associated protein